MDMYTHPIRNSLIMCFNQAYMLNLAPGVINTVSSYNKSLAMILIFKSLWIKASARLRNAHMNILINILSI